MDDVVQYCAKVDKGQGHIKGQGHTQGYIQRQKCQNIKQLIKNTHVYKNDVTSVQILVIVMQFPFKFDTHIG